VNKKKLLISACLCGENVRYDGKNNLINEFEKLNQKYDLIPFCPEIAGGMTVPRVPSEIISTNPLKVKDKNGLDTTSFFVMGAKKTLELCQQNDIKIALLKSKSPSCGNNKIYDGNFNGTLVKGQGLTVNVLVQNNVKIYNENQIGDLI
jgi:uncharacterized protein YbbK (DUF523 family)